MATYTPDFQIPGLINHRGNVRNGKAPSAEYMQSVVKATNHIAAYRKKCFYSYARPLNAIPAGGSSSRNCSWGYTWTGYNTTRLEFEVGFVPVTAASLTNCRIYLSRINITENFINAPME